MTRLDTLRALDKLPIADGYSRSTRSRDDFDQPDDAKLRIENERAINYVAVPKPSTSPIWWLHRVIEKRGA